MQIIIVRTIEVGKINGGRIGEGEIANRIMLGEHDHSPSILDLSLHRRGRSGGDKKGREGAQEACGGDIKFRFELIEMLITAFACGEMHEIPYKKRIGQREVAVNTGRGDGIAVEIHAFFEVAPLGNAPISRQRIMADICQK